MNEFLHREAAQFAADAAEIASLHWFDEVDSTQRVANELASGDSLATPALVIAATQTRGRGRGANRWWSSPGALTFSLIVDAASLGLEAAHLPAASIAAAHGVCEAVEHCGPIHCGVKWPNDVYADGKKLSGLLIDVKQPARGQPPRLVIGVGLNVNQSLAAAEPEVAASAVSVRELVGRAVDIDVLLVSLLMKIDAMLRSIPEAVAADASPWNDRSVLNGRRVQIESAAGIVSGIAAGVTGSGRLRLDTPAGPREETTGTVVAIYPPLR